MSKIQNKMSLEGRGEEELLELLIEEQDRFGYISGEFMAEIAGAMGLSISEVYGVTSFYSFLSIKPQGRHVIRICKSVPCYLKNSDMIIERVAKELGIKPGETTPDDRFSFELTNCIGACDQAPAIMINSDVHVDLTAEKISLILKGYE